MYVIKSSGKINFNNYCKKKLQNIVRKWGPFLLLGIYFTDGLLFIMTSWLGSN